MSIIKELLIIGGSIGAVCLVLYLMIEIPYRLRMRRKYKEFCKKVDRY